MIDQEEYETRFKDAIWSSYKDEITVGGVGGIGRWLSLFLARQGHSLIIYDMDVAGAENIGGGQLYGPSQIGTPKTAATRSNILQFVGSTKIKAGSEFKKNSGVTNICFATFDNMESRKDMFEQWEDLVKQKKKADGGIYCFINVAMGPEQSYIEVVDRHSRMRRWKEEWQPSDEIPDLPCTFKSTTHNAAMAASMAVSLFNNVIFNHVIGDRLRHVPYKVMIDLPLVKINEHE